MSYLNGIKLIRKLEVAEAKLEKIREEAVSWTIAKDTNDKFAKEICKIFGEKILAILEAK